MKNLRAVPLGSAPPVDTTSIPASTAHNIAQVAHRALLRDWNDPAIREDYRRWKAERAAAQKQKG